MLQGEPEIPRRTAARRRASRAPRHNRWVVSLPLRWRFYARASIFRRSRPLALGFVAGILTVLLGIGGGFILVPAMIYLLGMPARVVIGTSLVMILSVSAATTMVHAITTRAVDIVLAGSAARRRRDRCPIWRAADARGSSPISCGWHWR